MNAPHGVTRPTPLALYARSRAVPATLAALVCAALLTRWAASVPDVFLDPYRRVPLLSLAPLTVSAAIGTGLRVHGRELDDTAVRPWWRRRLAHLLVLTTLAATALGAVVFGARAAWMPTMLYFSAVYLSAASPRMREATVLAWPLQTGPQSGAWAAALALFVLGAGLYAARGARPEGPRG
ncbi:hypothetical protein [Streptomyces sp. NPDC059466]|uniref:hypothetical protein n=1 Tax=unclassified Streptomyces TaxID=2593676 RepID=UPI0036AFA8F7